jgi:hypothetical protein
MAGTEKRRSTEQRNPITIGVTGKPGLCFYWERTGAKVGKSTLYTTEVILHTVVVESGQA